MSTHFGQSYAQGSGVLECPLCDGYAPANNPCGTCNLPYRVIESILNRPSPPRFLGVLGPTGVGKTVYLGMLLDLLARGVCGLHGLAQSPFTLSLHRNLILSLERQRFPEKTPVESDQWDWVHCAVHAAKGKTSYDIITPDVAGEAVSAELENPGTNKTIRALISGCAGLVVLVDVLEVIEDGQGQELFAMQLVSYLDALRPGKAESQDRYSGSHRLHQDRPVRPVESRSGDVRQGKRPGALQPVSSAAAALRVLLLGSGRFDRPADRP